MALFEMPMEQLKAYTGTNPKPADFDAYWEEALRELEATGLEIEKTKADFEATGVDCFDVWFTGVDGARIHSILMMPQNAPGPVPGVVMFHPYLQDAGGWVNKMYYASSLGAALLAMDVRGQAGDSTDPVGGMESLFGQVVRGAAEDDPKALFFRSVYLDAVKAVRVLMNMPEVDEARIGVIGASQGGALTVAAAALEPRVKLAVPYFPFLSDFKRIMQMDLMGQAYEQFALHFRFRDPRHLQEDAFFERLGYIDIQHLAPRIRARVLWFTAMMDTVCPPSTQFAAYNKITSPKEMLLYPDFGHEPLYKSEDEHYSFFRQYL